MCIECICPAPPTAAEEAITTATANNVEITKKPAKPKSDPSAGPSVTNPNIPWDDVDVGSVVKIKGGISTFRDQKQVEIIKIEVLKSTDQEVKCWNEVLEFRKEVLRVPWVLSAEQEDKCRRRAMRESSRSAKVSTKKAGDVTDKRLERVRGGEVKRDRTSRSRTHLSTERQSGNSEARTRTTPGDSRRPVASSMRRPKDDEVTKKSRHREGSENYQQEDKYRRKV